MSSSAGVDACVCVWYVGVAVLSSRIVLHGAGRELRELLVVRFERIPGSWWWGRGVRGNRRRSFRFRGGLVQPILKMPHPLATPARHIDKPPPLDTRHAPHKPSLHAHALASSASSSARILLNVSRNIPATSCSDLPANSDKSWGSFHRSSDKTMRAREFYGS